MLDVSKDEGGKKQVWAGDLTYLVEYLPNMQDPGSIPCLASARHGGAHQSSSTQGVGTGESEVQGHL